MDGAGTVGNAPYRAGRMRQREAECIEMFKKQAKRTSRCTFIHRCVQIKRFSHMSMHRMTCGER